MKNVAFVIGLLVVLLIGAAGLAVVFYWRASEVPPVIVEEAPIGARSADSAEVARLSKRVAELEKELESAKAAGVEPAAKAASVEEKGKAGKGMMKTLAKMMSDPGMRDAMRQQQRVAVKGLYADFFSELALTEEEEAAVMELLLDKQMKNMELGMGMMGEGVTDADRKKAGEKIVEENGQIDEAIKEVLGEEAFESYELFVDSQQERMQLNSFKESLKATGEPLSYEAEEQLMNVMYETRKGFKFTTDFGSDAKPNPEAWVGFDQASADRMLAEMRRLQTEIATKASGVLNPDQLKAFEAAQESQLKMQEMGIKMALEMQQ